MCLTFIILQKSYLYIHLFDSMTVCTVLKYIRKKKCKAGLLWKPDHVAVQVLVLLAHFLFLPTFPQDDIQIVINQQLRNQQQSEFPLKKSTPNGLSFFRRQNRTASTWSRQASSSSTYSPDPIQDKSQSPWRDWLRRGKGLQSGKWWTVNVAPSA